jgi:hypothetical protein
MKKMLLILGLFFLLTSCGGYQMVTYRAEYRPEPVIKYIYYTPPTYYTPPRYYNPPRYYVIPHQGGSYHYGGGRR